MTDTTTLVDSERPPADAALIVATTEPPPPVTEPAPQLDKFATLRMGIGEISAQIQKLERRFASDKAEGAAKVAGLVIAYLAKQGGTARTEGANSGESPLPSAQERTDTLDSLRRMVSSLDESLKAIVEDRRAVPAVAARGDGIAWPAVAGAVVIALAVGGIGGFVLTPPAAPPADPSNGWATKIYRDVGPTLLACYKDSAAKNGASIPCTVTVSYPQGQSK